MFNCKVLREKCFPGANPINHTQSISCVRLERDKGEVHSARPKRPPFGPWVCRSVFPQALLWARLSRRLGGRFEDPGRPAYCRPQRWLALDDTARGPCPCAYQVFFITSAPAEVNRSSQISSWVTRPGVAIEKREEDSLPW